MIEEIRDFLEWGGGRLGGDTRSGVVVLAAAILTLMAAFFFVFTAAGLVAAVHFALGFLGPAVFLVAVTLGCEGSSVNG